MSGRIDFLFTAPGSVLGPIKNGRVVARAAGMRRSPALLNLPTLAEAGAPNAESSIWFGVLTPAKTPQDTVTRLHRETMNALAHRSPKKPWPLDIVNANALRITEVAVGQVARVAAG